MVLALPDPEAGSPQVPEEVCQLDREAVFQLAPAVVFPQGREVVFPRDRAVDCQPDPVVVFQLAPEGGYQLDPEEASRQGRAVDFQTRQTLGEATEKAAGIEHATTKSLESKHKARTGPPDPPRLDW